MRDPFALPELVSETRLLRESAPEPAERKSKLGEWTLGAIVGRGGMAELRLAHGPAGTPPRVIKLIAPQLAQDAEVVAMFREEAKIARLLDHPNIVRALDSGEVDGTPYILFELLDAVSLRELLEAAGTLSASIALSIAAALLDALAHGAPLGLIHRDVSPENVLITFAGQVKLADFGIARFEGRELETKLGDLKGKARYFAPEQLHVGPIDARADIYAVGIVLAESLGILESDPRSPLLSRPRTVPGELPRELHALVLALTAADPEDRPRTADLARREVEKLQRAPAPLVAELVQRAFANVPAPPRAPDETHPLIFGRVGGQPSAPIVKKRALPAWLIWGLFAIWAALLVLYAFTSAS